MHTKKNRNKLKIAYCFIALLLVCFCGAEKMSLPEKSPEQGEQSETMQANPPEESIMQPDAPSLLPTQSTEPEEAVDVEDVLVSQHDEPNLPPWPDAASSPMEVYQAALRGDISLVESTSGDVFDIAHINEIYVPGLSVELHSFSIVDLDNDGTPELILSMQIGSNSGFYIVLRCEDSVVYSFHFPSRGLDGIRKDGTFWTSGGANDSGICAVTFNKDQYVVDEIT